MTRLLFLGYDLGDRNEHLDRQKSYTVLVVLSKVLEKGYHFVDHNSSRHLLYELGKVRSSLTANHRGLVMDQDAELLA